MATRSPTRVTKRRKGPTEKEAEKNFYMISADKKVAQREYKNHLKAMTKYFRDYTRIAKVLYAGKAKHQAKWSNGRIVEKKDLRQLESQFAGLIEENAHYRKYANLRVPKEGQRGAARFAPKIGFIADPLTGNKQNQNLIGFFNNAAQQGYLNGPNGERPQLNQLLSSGWTTGAELGDLFIIYVHNRGLQDTAPKRSKFLKVAQDPLFMQWFGTTLDALEQRPVVQGKKRFSRNDFSFINLQQIISNNATSGLNMTDKQLEEAQRMRPVVATEAQQVGTVKAAWDVKLKPRREALKKQQQEQARLERASKPQVKRIQVKPAIRQM